MCLYKLAGAAMYSCADAGATKPENRKLKKSQPKAAMVKGLTCQLMSIVN